GSSSHHGASPCSTSAARPAGDAACLARGQPNRDFAMSETVLNREVRPRLVGAFAGLRARLRMDGGEAAVAVRVGYAGVAAYAVLFLFAAVIPFAWFKRPRLDLRDMVQAIWSTLHGHFLQFTTLDGHQRDRLGFHVDPFLLLLAPLFWIWSSPLL